MNPLFVLMIAAALQPKTIIPLRWYMFSIQEVDMHQYGALFWCRFAASLAGLPSNIPLLEALLGGIFQPDKFLWDEQHFELHSHFEITLQKN